MSINKTISIFILILLTEVFITAPFASASGASGNSDSATAQSQKHSTYYPISKFKLSYSVKHKNLPSVSVLLNTKVTLGTNTTGYVGKDKGITNRTRRIKNLTPTSSSGAAKFSPKALQAILVALRNKLKEQNIMGVYVVPGLKDISKHGKDLRADGDTTLHIVITVGRITSVHTIASGAGASSKNRKDNPSLAWIIDQSPLQGATENKQGSLLNKQKLDRYVYLLNRHPGRNVNASLSSSNKPAGINLDYQVTKSKPWSIYAGLSNTGSKQTNKLREQFGFYNNQLTGNDDSLSLNYTTAGFESSHAAFGRYEAPLGNHNQRLRWAANLRWSQYTASDVGFANSTFKGKSWGGKLELIPNLYQHQNFFLDALIGARYEWMKVSNNLLGTNISHQQNFILPFVGLRATMNSQWYSVYAKALIEGTDGSWLNATRTSVGDLGRPGADTDWVNLKWDTQFSVFLEPLFNYKAWSNPNSNVSHALANELSLEFSGQYSFGYRMVPQEQQIAGGMYTVRGYPQSAVAGDDVEVLRVAYKFHLPRVFSIQHRTGRLFGQPFRFSRQYMYGAPDWDLVPKAFIDVGHVSSNKGYAAAAEDSHTLVGAGIGVEASFKRNVRAELDWGFALRSLDTPGQHVSYGSNQLNFSVTLLY